MRLVFFRSAGFFARLVRWWTRGEWNHVAILDDDRRRLYEAREFVGVVETDLDERLASGRFAIFEPISPLGVIEREVLREFVREQLGKPYDFRSVLRFVTRRPDHCPPKAFFCSELAVDAFAAAGHPLLAAPGWKVSPETLSYSPLIRRVA